LSCGQFGKLLSWLRENGRNHAKPLTDAGVNSQLAKALADLSTEAAHEKYLRSTERARELRDGARYRCAAADALAQAQG